MFKLLISPLVLSTLLIGITACSGGSEPTSETAAQSPDNSQQRTDNDALLLLEEKFNNDINTPILQTSCIACHSSEGIASNTRLILASGNSAEVASINADILGLFPDADLLLNKVSNRVIHAGSGNVVLTSDSVEYQNLNDFFSNTDAYFSNTINTADTLSNNTLSNNTSSDTATDTGTINTPLNGEQIYVQQCAGCHNDDGSGGSATEIISALSRPDLSDYIANTMPYGAANDCTLDCAESVTNWMQNNLSVVDNTLPETLTGGELYARQCASCHGNEGNGGSSISITSALSRNDLPNYIATVMPLGSASNCDQNCADAITQWMLINFTAPVIATGDGATLYNQQCASCHGNDGNGTTPIISALNRNDLSQYIVNTMPYGSPNRCDQNCADDITNWMKLNFNTNSNSTPIDKPIVDIDATLASSSNDQVRELLYKISLNLVGRVPSESEMTQLDTQGGFALSNIIDAQFEEAAFIERIKNIFNDLLLTQGWDKKDAFHSFMRNYSWNSFENGDAEWIKADKTIPYYTTIRRYISNGHSRSPLELISYVIRKNRPFSEILTADYAMLNWYSAKSFGLENTASFRDLPVNEQLNSNFPKDPADFQPIQLPNVPSAGILTTGVYMMKYRTTASNRNRNRAYTVLKTFLDTDIFGIGGERPGDSDSQYDYPTLQDPNCVACHSVMDPIASSFKHWISKAGQGRPYYAATPSAKEWNSDYILAAGFNGEITPADADPMPWLAQKITQDPRFSRAMVKAVFQQITGAALIPATVDGVSFQSAAYLKQQAFIDTVADIFIAENFDFKAMVKRLAISEYTLGEYDSPLGDLMLSPEQLDKKIQTTLGDTWDNWLEQWNILYGGIDNNATILRNQNPNGTTATIQLRMAEDMACKVTAKEFSIASSERLLLGNIEPNILADSETNITRIKQTMVDIYRRLIGKQLSIDDPTISIAYNVYSSALTLGQTGIANGSISTGIASECRVPRSQAQVNQDYVDSDDNYYTRAWQAVIQFALMDPRFFYL